MDSSDDAIIGKTLDSVIRSWNRGASRIFGYEPEEIIGRSIITLIPEELQYQEADIVARLGAGQRIDHFETVRVRKDGRRIDVSLSVSPIRDRSGQIIGAAKVARDITEAKRLREAERELVEQLQELTAELEQQLEEGQMLQEELEQANEELATSLANAESARVEAEQARRSADEAQQNAEEARRVAEEANAVKGQFLATVSHELRTPLNAIAGYVELLEMEIRGPLTGPQRDDLARIRRSLTTLRRLIEDVLSFAKVESGRVTFHYEAVDLRAFLATLDAFILPRVERKGIAYRFDPDGCDEIVAMDRDKVEQILLNLLSNAVKFTDVGEIILRCRLHKEMMAIQVSDTGPGIPADARESIFEPFVQRDRSLTRIAEGTGLGLAISRQLARGMGGDVLVESEEGHGATFTLLLPRNRVSP